MHVYVWDPHDAGILLLQSLLVWCMLHCVHTKPGYEPPYGERLQPKPFKYQYGLQGAGAAFTKKEVQVRLHTDSNIHLTDITGKKVSFNFAFQF